MVYEEIIRKQKEWLKLLQPLNRNPPLMGQYLEGRIDDMRKPWVELNRNDVVVTRQILSREVIYDFDYKDWDKSRKEAKKLVKFMDENVIPHIVACSGGKGIHVHVFMDVGSFTMNEKLVERATEANIDIAKVIRRASFFQTINEKELKLKISTAADREGLDTSKVFFSYMNGSKGSLIRDFGCPRADGNFKSMIVDDIPKNRPKVREEEVVFPEKIEQAKMDKWRVSIEESLKEMIEKSENTTDFEGFKDIRIDDDIPCYRKLVGGTGPGARNLAVFTISRLGTLIGKPKEETMRDVKEFCKNSNYKESEAVQTMNSAYRYREPRTFCGTIKFQFGSEICDSEKCPIQKEKARIQNKILEKE